MTNGLKYLRMKQARGRAYYYFDTGRKGDNGKPVLVRLPHISEPTFAASYAAALGNRTKRENRANALTVRGLIDKWQISPEFHALAASTKINYARYCEVAARLLVDRAGQSAPAASIEPRDVMALRDLHHDRKGAASQLVRVMGALYAWGSKPERGLVPRNPAIGISLFEAEPHEPWPDELLEAGLADEEIGMAVALFYFTGQRINEVAKMRWSDIRGDTIKVYVQKTKTDMTIPLIGELADKLERHDRRTLTILHNSNGQPWTISGLRWRLQKWARERGQKVVPHGLRKNAVNSLLLAGCSTAEVSGITGQSLQLVAHYAKQINREQLGRSAVIKLDEARRNKSGK